MIQSQLNINIILMVGLAVLGWLARELWSVVKELYNDFAKLREDLPRQYVAQDYYREDIRELKAMTDKIYDRMEAKVKEMEQR